MPPKQHRNKSTGVAYAWHLTLGWFGAHQYYLGNTSRGVLYTFTIGLFFVGWAWDLFTLSRQTQRANDSINMRNLAQNSAAALQYPSR